MLFTFIFVVSFLQFFFLLVVITLLNVFIPVLEEKSSILCC